MPAMLRTLQVAPDREGYWTLVAHVPDKGFEIVEWWSQWCNAGKPPEVTETDYATNFYRAGFGANELCLVYATDSQAAWHVYRTDYRSRHPRARKVAV